MRFSIPALTPRTAIIGAVFVVTVGAAILLALGRTAICSCGEVWLWSGDVTSQFNSQQLTDPYTFTHLLHGVLFFALLALAARRWPMSLSFRFLLTAILETSWEVIENSEFAIQRYREATISLNYYGDSVVNSVVDVVACLAAFWIVSKIPVRWTVAGVIAIELLLLFFIRDNLTLNILMILYPIEAVKVWQAGG